MDAAEDLSRFTNHFQQLCAIVTKLRAPGGCPWDREQTHESLLPALIEEAYEVALPALMRAQKAQSKAARVNFDWIEVRNVVAKVYEELGEVKQAIASQDGQAVEDEIGDLLFAVVNLARKCKLDAESALQTATDKFVARFNRLEDELQARGKRLGDVDLAELDAIWDEIKRNDE